MWCCRGKARVADRRHGLLAHPVAAPGAEAGGIDRATIRLVARLQAVLPDRTAELAELEVGTHAVTRAADPIVADFALVAVSKVVAVTACRNAGGTFRRRAADLAGRAAFAVAAGHAGAARAPADDCPLVAIATAFAVDTLLIRPAAVVV